MAAPVVVGEVWQARELLRNLISKELKVRYKGSFLGFAWSLVTPLLLTAIFTVVFATFLRIPFGDGNFATYFLAGYLVWQFFANSVSASVQSITGNGSLIRKVYFPREVLPLSLVVSQGVHLLLALVATAPLFIALRGFHPEVLPGLLVALVLLAAFTAGIAMVVAALNVRFRDLAELLPVLLQAWFYATPIIYPIELVATSRFADVFLPLVKANPMTRFADLFHRLLYGIPTTEGVHAPPTYPTLRQWAICLVVAGVTLVLGWALFRRLAGTFAKEV